MAPFSLAIFGDSVGISYFVEVFNSTAFLSSRNGVNVTEFSYPIPSKSACTENWNQFTVSPVNIVGIGEPSAWNFSQLIECKHSTTWIAPIC